MANATATSAVAGLGLISLKMLAALLFLLALLYGLLWLVRRYGFWTKIQGHKEHSLVVEERIILGPRKFLVVVRFLNKKLLLGVTDSRINLVAEYEAHEKSLFSETLEKEHCRVEQVVDNISPDITARSTPQSSSSG